MKITPSKFQQYILDWFDQHGRKHFPWQKNKTAYRVWISEIMLQQTQVNTVIPYYEKFMQEFPDLKSLANAHEDKVLHLWAGLGYYSRARNLHRAAKMVIKEFHGKFPDNPADLQKLPGIGRSTAAAILSIAFNQKTAILDGNVKRVLSRFHGITEVPDKKVENDLWILAERYMPAKRAADYTQAIMDLGATICVRKNPLCKQCPLMKYCLACKQEMTHLIPAKKNVKALPERVATMLILQNEDQVFLLKRPPIGIWGGLWSFPEIEGEPDKKNIQSFCLKRFNMGISDYQPLDAFRHTFTHFHLHIHPVVISVKRKVKRVMEDEMQIWYKPSQPESVGLPKPVQLIMRKLR